MVAHTGFEPVISAVKGRHPRPLDECARPMGRWLPISSSVRATGACCQEQTALFVAKESQMCLRNGAGVHPQNIAHIAQITRVMGVRLAIVAHLCYTVLD